MSKLLEEAIAKLAKLSEADQDSIAAWLIEGMKSEERWEELFSKSHDALERLADEAVVEHLRGGAKELDPDNL